MFETAELGQKVAKRDYERRVPEVRAGLLEAQVRMREVGFPLVLVLAGVDGAGKSETANLLNAWMDPRWILTRAYGEPSQEEAERPEYWRYWRDLPGHGQAGVFLSAWYHEPLVGHVLGRVPDAALEDRLERIQAFERTLANDGAVVLKLWFHLGKKQQKRRLQSLEKDPLQSWRVSEQDWHNWRLYDDFVATAERIIMHTSTGRAPWVIVEGGDPRYRALKTADEILAAIQRRLDAATTDAAAEVNHRDGDEPSAPTVSGSRTVLSAVDLGRSLSKEEYTRCLEKGQGRLNLLSRTAREHGLSTVLVFEGWDAAGKGGAIRRLTPALDARSYQVIPIGAPSQEELQHHYLWRFWRHLPRAGRFAIFDRSWYGRVLVERVEGFASEAAWRRAYAEINDFERRLVEHGMAVVKFWLHISQEEQARRFEGRSGVSFKRWKLTDEDIRNRDKWELYERAVHDMVERTSTHVAPWHLVCGEDKRHARIEVLDTVCAAVAKSLPGDRTRPRR
jgi:polyphosphate:AMP phosphotransferase